MQLSHPIATAAPAGFGFQLPTLHAEIPMHAVVLTTAIPDVGLIRTLIDIGVIDPVELRDSITTAPEILADGMTAWLNHQVGDLERLNFGCGLIPAEDANGFVEAVRLSAAEAGYDVDDLETPLTLYKGPAFTVSQPGMENFFLFAPAAKVLEGLHPGLFAAALEEINLCSRITVPIRTADELFDRFCMDWYDGYDWSEAINPKNLKSIKNALKARFEGEPIKGYLPEAVRKDFGMEYWYQPGPKPDYSSATLKNIARTSKSRLVKSVCKELITLREKRAIAEKKKAYLPRLPSIEGVEPLFAACGVQFEENQHMKGTLDDHLEQGMNQGDRNSRFFGLEELPTNPKKLESFFNRLETAFTVLRHMDRLITVITPYTK